MKNPDPNDPGDAQEVDISDVDLSAAPEPPVVSRVPPPLPPMASMQPQAPSPPQVTSQAPQGPSLPPTHSQAPAPPAPGRGPLFYIGMVVAVLVVTIGGTAVALSRRRPPAVAQAPNPSGAAQKAPNVITIGVVEVNDEPDAGP